MIAGVHGYGSVVYGGITPLKKWSDSVSSNSSLTFRTTGDLDSLMTTGELIIVQELSGVPMTIQQIKAHDTAITFTATLKRLVAGVLSPVNLTGASVKFNLHKDGVRFSANASVVTPLAGEVSYAVGVGFPSTPGRWEQEWEVTFGDATKLSFPSDENNIVEIVADLNNA